MGCSSGIWGERLAYLAISDLLSGPECGMTAREGPQRLETCLHLCISHINKFSHRCIQTSLSALLHTTHSCHKHSDTQSTTTVRKRERKRKGRGEERESAQGEKGRGGRRRRGEKSEKGQRRGRRRDENVERRPALRNCAQRSVWPSRNLLKAGRRPARMKEARGSGGNEQGAGAWGAKGCKRTEHMKYQDHLLFL